MPVFDNRIDCIDITPSTGDDDSYLDNDSYDEQDDALMMESSLDAAEQEQMVEEDRYTLDDTDSDQIDIPVQDSVDAHLSETQVSPSLWGQNEDTLMSMEEKMTVLQSSLPSGLKSLHLINTNLRHLSGDVFRRLTNLRLLSLEGNSLTELPHDLFHGLTKLKALYLGSGGGNPASREDVFDAEDQEHSANLIESNDNAITFLHADQFRDLVNLEILHLGES